jgi:hypothetical protein
MKKEARDVPMQATTKQARAAMATKNRERKEVQQLI